MNPTFWTNSAIGWLTVGRIKEALSLREKLRTLEPFAPQINYITASIMRSTGRARPQSRSSKRYPQRWPAHTALAHAYAAQGRYGEAADILLAITGEDQRLGPVEDAARLIRSAPTKVKAPEALPALEGELSFVYVYVGAPDRVLDFHERLIAEYNVCSRNKFDICGLLISRRLRKTERFKALMRAAGLVDYWRARGWPDCCRPVGADDFVCV